MNGFWATLHHSLAPSFDMHLFTYWGNRSTEDTVVRSLYAAPSPMEKQRSYFRMLFVDYSSRFNSPHSLPFWWTSSTTWGFHTLPAYASCLIPLCKSEWASTPLRPSASALASHRAVFWAPCTTFFTTPLEGLQMKIRWRSWYQDGMTQFTGTTKSVWCKENNPLLYTIKTKKLNLL